MSNNTSNTTAFIEAQQYSNFMLTHLQDGLLPENFYRNVTDFGTGTTLNIKTVGARTLQDVEENTPIEYRPIDTGTVQLTITDYVGDAWYITDKLRQDGANIEQLLAENAQSSTRALQEYFETRFFATANAGQTANDANTINGFAHRRAASGANGQMTEADFIDMKLAFDKANVPYEGRVVFVDPIVGATLSKLITLTSGGMDRNPTYQMLQEQGFARNHRFLMDLHGWLVIESNRLPRITAAEGSLTGDSDATSVGSIANIFMCVADDQTKPVMTAWRQMPKAETERNKDLARDEFLNRARFGMGVQRKDTLGVILSHPTATA